MTINEEDAVRRMIQALADMDAKAVETADSFYRQLVLDPSLAIDLMRLQKYAKLFTANFLIWSTGRWVPSQR